MRNAQFFIVGIIFFFCMQACTERMICPAYQSAFIHDEEQLQRRFSYFKEDSTPKILTASKDRYNIIEPVSYKKKRRQMRTVPMKDVYPIEEDSLAFDDEFALAERDISSGYDSTAVISIDTLAANPADSIYMISLKKENFNIDQELYLWYLKDFLVYPDVRITLEEAAIASGANGKAKKEKKGFFGFFKNLFKKKDKSDSTAVDGPENTSAIDVEEEPKKKGIFGFLKKDPNKKKKEKKQKNKKADEAIPANNEETTPPPAEEEDDGENDF